MTGGADLELREWVEQLAILLERDGLPRMAGRIFGWLLVCEPAEQTSEDLARAVQGSKASMSTMTRLLVDAKLVRRERRPGTRRDVFRVLPGQWQEMWRARMAMVSEITLLAERGMQLLARRAPESQARLVELHAQYRFVERVFPEVLARWEQERAAELARAARERAAQGPGPGRAGRQRAGGRR
jgi:DNA-binding transcriptional regulator GbsR (MarR family)